MADIHPTAILGQRVTLGERVEIGPYAVIGDDVSIGGETRIGPHVVIHSHTTLGPRCRVHATAVLGDEPQDLAFSGVQSYTHIGSDCTIREGVTIHRGTKEGTATTVGDRCYLMACSHVAHNAQIGQNVILVNGVLLAGYVEVDDGAFLGGAAVVHQFTKIGRMAMLGGQSGIGKDIPPYCMTESATRNSVIGLNLVGMKRAGLTVEERKQVKLAFGMLYRSRLPAQTIRANLEAGFPEGPASEFWKFMDRSHRGLCGLARKQDIAE